ncbi:FecR family protein [Porticoccus sp. GXU_MW_L64]
MKDTVFKALPDAVNQQANEWLTLQNSGEFAPHQQAELKKWLEASGDHREGYRQAQMIWDGLADMANTPEAGRLRNSVTQPSVKTGVLQWLFTAPAMALAASLVVAAGLFLLLPSLQTNNSATENYLAAAGEIRQITLADNTQVLLGADSAIEVTYRDNRRTVSLLRGEAFFDVASNPNRPFVVDTEQLQVTVVGTRFEVSKRTSSVSVAVEEGIVDVADLSAGADIPSRLTAHQKVVKHPYTTLSDIVTVAPDEVASWRNGRLIYRDVPLRDIIADANRYFDGTIMLTADSLFDQRITLTVNIEDIASLPTSLGKMLPIKSTAVDDHTVILVRDGAGAK